jgi:hypothetical protein
MTRPIHIAMIAVVVLVTVISTAFITSEIIAARAIAVVNLDECLPNMDAETKMVDYLHRIEVKIDDVRTRVVTFPSVGAYPYPRD